MPTPDGSLHADLAAALVVDGNAELVIEAASADTTTARAVSALVAELLVQRAIAQPHTAPADCDWLRCDRGVVRLASVDGADAVALANGLLGAVVRQSTFGRPQLDPDAAMWIAATVPDALAGILLTDDWELRMQFNTSDLELACFRASGPLAAEWFVSLLRRDIRSFSLTYQAMQCGEFGRWATEDWVRRFAAIAESELPVPGFVEYLFVGEPPPPESAPGLSQLITTRIDDPTDPTFQQVVQLFRGWRTGEPANDAALFWWPTDVAHVSSLRSLLEFSGPAGSAGGILDVAEAAGVLDPAIRTMLGETVGRPAWVDGEVPWVLEPVTEVHDLAVPTGRLAIGDPVWGEGDEPSVEVAVPPGTYVVRVIRANHPLEGRFNVAAETVIDADAEPVFWERAPGPFDGRFNVGNGLAVIGAPGFCSGQGGGEEVEGFDFEETAGVIAFERHPDGGGVACYVGPQHHDVQSWTGRDSAGRVVRVVSEFGILHDLDPTQRPLPW